MWIVDMIFVWFFGGLYAPYGAEVEFDCVFTGEDFFFFGLFFHDALEGFGMMGFGLWR